MKLAASLFIAALLVTPTARADCVWIPVCLAYQTPPIDALLVFLDGAKTDEKRPMWYGGGGRTGFWTCGRSTSILTLQVERAGLTAPMLFSASSAGLNEATCTQTGPPSPPPTIGSYYGPTEQLIRAVRSAQSGGPPIDVDQNGRVEAQDLRLLELIARGQLGDRTDFICAEDVCP